MKSAHSFLSLVLKFKSIIFLLIIGSAFFVSAQPSDAQPLYSNSISLMPREISLDEVVSSYSIWITIIASILIAVLSVISLKVKKQTPQLKKILFFSIASVVVGTTLFLASSTIYLNSISSSGGPVHWHSDIEIWACGQEVQLKDPQGWSNKIGTATLHEHNDKRIHLEGVVVSPQDASLGKFFSVIGGEISPTLLTVPTNTELISYNSGNLCPNGQIAQVQVFAYKTIMGKYEQYKITDPEHYIISPFSAVPPGDCIIIEFDAPKESTEKLCTSYKVAQTLGKIQKGYSWE